jgi:tetratricopeptide (TPR) repeat protein
MKKLIYTLLLIIALTNNSFAAGSSSDSDSTPKASDYTKAKNLINSAKKYEKKGKIDKAQERYAKAQKLLLKSNEIKPLQADTLNYLGFTTRKLGDFKGGEKFYLQGLQIEPNHNGINEYLGELYVVTNRMDMAKERLEILKICNCAEYEVLKEIIDGTKKSKY